MNDPLDSEVALAAMNRAFEAARIRAIRFGSRLVLWKDGAVVLVDPQTLDVKQNSVDHPSALSESDSDGGDPLNHMAEEPPTNGQ